MPKLPYLGFGLGLRPTHYPSILENQHPIDWFEIISEDFFVAGGSPWSYLEKIRANYPMVMHGVSMSIGSSDPLKIDYLKRLKETAERIEAAWISDHLCWTGIKGENMHDLLPLPYHEESLKHVVGRVKQAQDILGQRIALENPSTYVSFNSSSISEWEFLAEVAKQADCLILLDINNVFVSGFNHGFDPYRYIDAIPASRVQQFHLAGHTHCDEHIIDTHDHPIVDEVWRLYQYAVERFPNVSTLLERDDHIPEFPILYQELMQAKAYATSSALIQDTA